MRAALVAAVIAFSTITSPAGAATLLTDVTDYNAYFFHAFSGTSSDVEGRLAVGGRASISSYGIAQAGGVDFGDTYTLVVGGHLNASNGQLFQGSALAGSALIANNFNAAITYSGAGQPTLDFAREAARLTTLSNVLSLRTANGAAQSQYGALTLTGTDSALNIFTITAADLSNKHSFVLNAPAGSSALINVTGSAVSLLNQGFTLNGIDRGDVLFNFIDATSLSLQGIGFQGSVLAPKATIAFNNGQLNGLIIGNEFLGNGQINHAPYTGGLLTQTAAVPEPATWLMMIAGVGMTGAALRRRRRADSRNRFAPA